MNLRIWQCKIVLMLLQNCRSHYYNFQYQMSQVENPNPNGPVHIQQQHVELQPYLQLQQSPQLQQPIYYQEMPMEAEQLPQSLQQLDAIAQLELPLEYQQVQSQEPAYLDTYAHIQQPANLRKSAQHFRGSTKIYKHKKYRRSTRTQYSDNTDSTDEYTEDDVNTDDSIHCMCNCEECYYPAECCLQYCFRCPPLVTYMPAPPTDLVVIPYAVPVVIFPIKSLKNESNETMVVNKTTTFETTTTTTSEKEPITETTLESVDISNQTEVLRSKNNLNGTDNNEITNENETVNISDDKEITEDGERTQYDDTIEDPEINTTDNEVKPKYYLIAEQLPQNRIVTQKPQQNVMITPNLRQNMIVRPKIFQNKMLTPGPPQKSNIRNATRTLLSAQNNMSNLALLKFKDDYKQLQKIKQIINYVKEINRNKANTVKP